MAEKIKLTDEQIEAVVDWLNEWEWIRGTSVPIRFKEDFVQEESREEIAAFCQCGGLVYSCKESAYKRDKELRHKIENYIIKGYEIRYTELGDFECKYRSNNTL